MRPIQGLREIMDDFDTVLIDQFGVLHDGQTAYTDALNCLYRLGNARHMVIVLSNSGRRAEPNRKRLTRLGFPENLYFDLVTSGEVAWQAIQARQNSFYAGLGRNCLVVSEKGDTSFIEGLDLELQPDPERADFILVVGVDTPVFSLDAYEPMLSVALQRNLPMLCTNGDLVRLTQDGLRPAPGALAKSFEERGGSVTWYGKPLEAIFNHCFDLIGSTDGRRVLMIGDSLDHDIAGAKGAGIKSVFIRQGIGEGWSGTRLRSEVDRSGCEPDFILDHLRW